MSAGGPAAPQEPAALGATPGSAARVPAWLDVAAIAATFSALYLWTYRRWPDVVVDYGRELYVPWRMLEGEQLFRDLSWFNGPLSPHWNALAFRLFGVGLSTLVAVDVIVFACILALLHGEIRAFASRTAATLACLVVMCACGFGQLIFIGNYNFMTPYSHEATHGVLLGLAAVAAARRARVRGSAAWSLASGLSVGLAFLTKPEAFVAAAAGAGVGVGLPLWTQRSEPSLYEGRRVLPAVALGALLPIAASWLLLRGVLGASGAWTATLGAWPQLVATDVSGQRFYLASMGLDRPWENLAAMLRSALYAAGVLVPSALLALVVRAPRWRLAGPPIAAAATLLACFALYRSGGWEEAARAWPLVAAIAFAVFVRRALTGPRSTAWTGAAAFAAFSLAMTAKMLLNARLHHYGFALGLPATALVVAVAWSVWPAWLEAAGGSAAVARAGVAAALVCFAGIHLVQTGRMQAAKTVEMGSGPDRFWADARGQTVNAALAWLAACPGPDGARPTLAVLPEGVTLNYLARIRNPTPYFNFMPPEIILFEENRILEAFRSRPPDLVLLVHKDTSEYGLRYFGRDYARQLGAWLQSSYAEVERLGDPPFRPRSRFGIDVLARRGPDGKAALHCLRGGSPAPAAPPAPRR